MTKVLAAGREAPFEVKNKGGQTSILIYPRGRGGYVFRFYLGGKAKTVERVDRQEAVKEALRIAAAIDAGSAQAAKLTAADMESYVHAMALLPEDAPPLHAVVGEWVAIRQAIGAAPVSELLAVWKRAGRRSAGAAMGEASTVSALTAVYLAELRARAVDAGSQRYLEGFQADLPRFGEQFGAAGIAELSVGQLEKWLRGLGVGSRRQDNLRGELVTFFRWARERGHLDEDRKTEPEKIARLSRRTKDVEFWRPREMCALLEQVTPAWLPCLAIAAFAGLRISEIGRLDWSAFDWGERRVYVRKSVALKTGRSRRVPLSENLVEWLAPYRQASGKLYDYRRFSSEWSKETERLAEKTKLTWRANNLRHAYGSYQMALADNYGEVSTWMGNTPKVVQDSYDGVARPEEAKDWFGIRRDREGKVVIRRDDADKVIAMTPAG